MISKRYPILFIFALVMMAITTISIYYSAQATELFTVNSTADPGDGICDASECTLREAITAANTITGTDTIAFNIPGAGPHTIQPTSSLPIISDPVVIDGYTQPGASLNTNPPEMGTNAVLMIELDGSLAGPSESGLRITSGNSIIRGLVINRFTLIGVWLETNGGNVIEGNLIGTDVTGSVDLGNLANGVTIDHSPDNVIGGTAPGARNVISGNDSFGVSIRFNGATGNLVLGNLIGTDRTGTVDLGNTLVGVGVNASSNAVGGTSAGARNIISGNGGHGIQLAGVGAGVTNTVVQGNFIGTDISGANNLGNSGTGVAIFDNANDLIGGDVPGAGNLIAHNSFAGIFVSSGTGNAVLSNSIFSNAGLGIDLSPGGVTPNDPGDVDIGANNLQNYPILSLATSDGTSTTTITGALNSTLNTSFRVEFFSNSSCDPSNHGEGENFIASTDLTTDGNGDTNLDVTIPMPVPIGSFITATATDPDGNSSEFSACVTVISGDVLVIPIDIKPGADVNAFNCRENVEIPVAILTTAQFDALSVDHTTVTFEGASEIHTDPRTGGPVRLERDVDRDGDLDLLFHFRFGDTNLTCGSTFGTLIGETFIGQAVEGSDSVLMITRPR